MAIGIRNFPNVTPPDSDYPDGRIKDDSGINDGTPINVKTNGDIQEFFAKLLRLAGIAPNNKPENEYVGHQYIDAIEKFVSPDIVWHNVGAVGEPSFNTGYTNATGSLSPVRFSKKRNSIRIIGTLGRATSVATAVVFILPLAYRPVVDIHTPLMYYEEAGSPYACHLWVKTNGEVALLLSGIPSVANGFGYINAEFIINSQ